MKSRTQLPEPTGQQGNGAMNHSIRLSRISHPRATIWALALVAAVFLAFGAWADARSTRPEAGLTAGLPMVDAAATINRSN
jgi:hypothetical protein